MASKAVKGGKKSGKKSPERMRAVVRKEKYLKIPEHEMRTAVFKLEQLADSLAKIQHGSRGCGSVSNEIVHLAMGVQGGRVIDVHGMFKRLIRNAPSTMERMYQDDIPF
jgi:hypothetical protein